MPKPQRRPALPPTIDTALLLTILQDQYHLDISEIERLYVQRYARNPLHKQPHLIQIALDAAHLQGTSEMYALCEPSMMGNVAHSVIEDDPELRVHDDDCKALTGEIHCAFQGRPLCKDAELSDVMSLDPGNTTCPQCKSRLFDATITVHYQHAGTTVTACADEITPQTEVTSEPLRVNCAECIERTNERTMPLADWERALLNGD